MQVKRLCIRGYFSTAQRFYTLWRYHNIVCLLAITNAVPLSCNQRPIYSCESFTISRLEKQTTIVASNVAKTL
jgi:hypothetical protein